MNGILFLAANMCSYSYLPPFRLVFDVVCWSNFGFDILQVWQWLVNKPKLFGSGRRFGRSANDGDLLLTGHQDGRLGGSWCVRSSGVAGGSRSAWGAWGVARWGAGSDGSWSRGSGCWGATFPCSANWLGPCINTQQTTALESSQDILHPIDVSKTFLLLWLLRQPVFSGKQSPQLIWYKDPY